MVTTISLVNTRDQSDSWERQTAVFSLPTGNNPYSVPLPAQAPSVAALPGCHSATPLGKAFAHVS